ncbi:hypothetical protein GO986_07245 [Deinococcus sp. HMF7620]|uniref:Uncharacterized protein n=1 Tax=Deinococcus arboris TaxID=2682977 RepID=A0A7C9M819_9DEIO|nr:hypothetical protein [Deinococcus arboris]MVN86559.1 hypothetical protein [Deinococcus arboris]
MGSEQLPAIDVLEQGMWQVVAVLGVSKTTNGKRQLVVIFKNLDAGQTNPTKLIYLPIEMLPLLWAGATFKNGILQRPDGASEIYKTRILPRSENIIDYRDRIRIKQYRKDITLSAHPVDNKTVQIISKYVQPDKHHTLAKYVKYAYYRNGFDIYIIPIMEIIRYHYALFCSSRLINDIFSGKLESEDSLNSFINTRRSFSKDNEAFLVLRKEYTDSDRLILGLFYKSQRHSYFLQAINISASLRDGQSAGDFFVCPYVKFPFTRRTNLTFQGTSSIHKASNYHFKIHWVERILYSQFRLPFERLEYDRDNTSLRRSNVANDRVLPIGWQQRQIQGRLRKPKRLITNQIRRPRKGIQPLRHFFESPLSNLLAQLKGGKVTEGEPVSQSGGESTPIPVEELTVQPPQQHEEGDLGQIQLGPDLSPPLPIRPPVGFDDLTKALQELQDKGEIDRYEAAVPENPFALTNYSDDTTSWLKINETTSRSGVLFHIVVGTLHFYIYDIERNQDSTSVAVIRRPNAQEIDIEGIESILKEGIRIRGRWQARSEKNRPRLDTFAMSAIGHAYTSSKTYGAALLRAAHLGLLKPNTVPAESEIRADLATNDVEDDGQMD